MFFICYISLKKYVGYYQSLKKQELQIPSYNTAIRLMLVTEISSCLGCASCPPLPYASMKYSTQSCCNNLEIH